MTALLLLAGVIPGVRAQGVSEVTLEASPQLFAVLCAARAGGQGGAAASAESRAVLTRVEAALAQLNPESLGPLRAFFREQQPAPELSAFISTALVLGPPPEFELALPRDQLPPDVWPLEGLPPLVGDFYRQAGLEQLWRDLHPFYERALAARQAEAARVLLETRAYLRLIGDSYPGRSYVVYLEWLVPPGLTSARNYGDNYYLAIHPERPDFQDAVRHQYLHFLLDPVTAKYAGEMRSWAGLQPLAERAPRLPPAFRNDILLLATESLIQAVELRLQRLELAAAAAQLEESERAGYLFTRHFFQALERFEQAEPSLRYYFPELLRGLDVEQERARLGSVKFAPAEAAAAVAAPAREAARRLLAEGNALLTAGNYPAARERFQRLLQEVNPNEPGALYGLAILASVAQDREQAKHYFLRTLEQAREPHLLGWAHVYLGRIYDLEGERQQALEHYQAALTLETRLDKVERAARRGLERPFGQQEESEPPAPPF